MRKKNEDFKQRALCLGLVFFHDGRLYIKSTSGDRKPATKSESSDSSDKDTKKKPEPTESLSKEAKANSDKVAEALKKTEAFRRRRQIMAIRMAKTIKTVRISRIQRKSQAEK